MDAGHREGSAGELGAAKLPRARARHLPGYIYRSEHVLALEMERIFLREWLCIARIEELAKPGDYLATRILDEPLLVVRGDDGELRAFSNLCAHRGVEVIQGSGNAKEFSCPYHGWAYRLDGGLIGAPYMTETEGFDPAACGLPRLRLATWAGWVFVNFAADSPPLDHHLKKFAPEFEFLHQERCRLGGKTVATLDCNWKLVAENLVDIYHVHVLHRNSFGRGRRPVDYLRDRADLTGYYEAPPMAPGGKSMFGKMPWLADRPDNAACMGHLDPNLQLFGRSDAIHVIVVWPKSATQSEVVFYDLFPEESFALPDFAAKAKVYRDYWQLVLDEDRSMIESLQRAMSSTRFRPGPMSSLEHGVHRLINRYLDLLFPDMPAGQAIEPPSNAGVPL